MEKFLKHLPLGLLLSFIVKMIVVTPSFADMGIVFALATLVGVQILLDKKEDFQTVKEIVNKQNEVIQVMAVEHAKMKNILEGVKLKSDFKNDGIKRVG